VKEAVAYDLSAEMLAAVTNEAAKRGLANVVTARAAEKLPFADESFDVVVTRYSATTGATCRPRSRRPSACSRTTAAPWSSMRCRRVCRCSTRTCKDRDDADPSHVRDYSVDEWKAMLTRAGFRTGSVTCGGSRSISPRGSSG